MTHFDYDTDEETVTPGATFTLGGRQWTCRSRDHLPFTAERAVFALDDDGQLSTRVEPFFRVVLMPDDVEPFVALLNDTESGLTVAKVQRIIRDLAAEVFGFPTTPPARSGTPSRRRRRSVAGSASGDSPPIASVG